VKAVLIVYGVMLATLVVAGLVDVCWTAWKGEK
jgi:hypothetical protein